MKIKKNIALKLIQDLIRDEKFKDLIDLISSTSTVQVLQKMKKENI